MAIKLSDLEQRVYNALQRAGWKREQISMQYPIRGGRSTKGGQVVDFVLWTPAPIPVETNGEYWHRNDTEEFIDSAEIEQEFGRPLVVIWGDEAETDESALATVIRLIGRGG